MANAWEKVDLIAAEALTHMEDALVISKLATKDKTADFNTRPNGYAVGDTVRIKSRPDYQANEFTSAIAVQSIRETKRSMTIEKHYDISVEITAKEKALDMESFSEQVIMPAAYRLAEKCDIYVGTKILEAAGLYTSDDLFASAADMAASRKAATIQQLNPTSRYCLVDLSLEAKLLGASYFSTYNNRGDAGSQVFAQGAMGAAMGMQFFSSINFPVATAFTSGTMICQTNNGAGGNTNNQIGATSLTVDTQTASRTVKAGDRLAIAGVRRPLKVLTTIADTSATTTVVLVDPITEIIPDNAAVTVISTGTAAWTPQGAIFDGDSLAVAMPVLDAPSDKPSQVISNNGYSIRVVQGYDMASKKETLSLDLLIGATAYDPRRITLLANY